MTNELFDGFCIIREVARGGSGVVYEATSPDSRRVALKVLDRTTIESNAREFFESLKVGRDESVDVDGRTGRAYEKYVERFKREYQVLIGLDHPHIAKVYKIGFFDNRLYIVSEFIDGESIAKRVRGWNPVDMIPMFIQSLEAFDYIHRSGLIHLDIKPGNILVQSIDGKPHVKIIDFGMAMAPGEYKGMFLGTIDTMAPEVVLGLSDKVDARADLFSFGMVMYYCITWGGFPYARTRKKDRDVIRRFMEKEAELHPDPPSYAHSRTKGFVPAFLDTIVMRLLSHNPEDRFYTNARSVINALLTHAPDVFAETPDTRGAYLLPEGGRHIGRRGEVTLLERMIGDLLKGKTPDYPCVRIVGGAGMGKTHLLGYLKECAERNVERISIHHVAFPADDDMLDVRAAEIMQALADGTRPVLVLADDIHEFSSRVRDMINGVMRAIAERRRVRSAGLSPIALITTATSSHSPLKGEGAVSSPFKGEGWGGGEGGGDLPALTIELSPFSRSDIKEYLKATPAFKHAALPGGYADYLHRMTAGIPREIVDTLEKLDRSGLIFDATGNIVMAEGVLSRSPVPSSTQDRLVALYESLTPREREVADIIACWRFKRFLHRPRGDEIVRMTGRISTVQTLHALTQRGLLHHDRGEDAYSFAQGEYMANLIHERMDGVWRGICHDTIAEYLVSSSAAGDKRRGLVHSHRDEKISDAIALHRLYGTHVTTAVLRTAIVAARRIAFKHGFISDGAQLCTFILGYISGDVKLRLYVMNVLIDVYYRLGRFQDARDVYDQAVAMTKSDGTGMRLHSLRLLMYVVPVFTALKRYDEAIDAVARARELLGASTAMLARPRLLNLEARLLYERRGDNASNLARAKILYEESAALERELPDDALDRITNNQLGTVLFAMGDYENAEAALEEKYRRETKAGNWYNGILTALTLAETYRMQRKFERAEHIARWALETAHAKRQQRLLPFAHEIRAKLFHDMDRFDAAIDEDRRSLAASALAMTASDYKDTSIRLWLHMGHCYKELKRWNEAIVHFEAALGEQPEDMGGMSALEGAGEAHYYKGDFKKALSYFDKAVELLGGLAHNAATHSHAFRIAKLKADLFLKTGEVKKAVECMATLENSIDGDELRKREYLEIKERLAQTVVKP